MTREYNEFLQNKLNKILPSGFTVDKSQISEMLYQWQRDLVVWHLAKGKSALFADCGLGKTMIQVEFAYHVHKYTNKPVLILAPLAVSKQTRREADKIGRSVNICMTHNDVINGINITNYERIEKFESVDFSGIVLDESSILKNYAGKTRTYIIDRFERTSYKLCCTATPSPNDFMEIGNHSEFLNIMSRVEMLATFFVHDCDDTQTWRLKGHAKTEFYKWLAQWCVFMRTPEDIGFDDKRYILPEINVNHHIMEKDIDFNNSDQIELFQVASGLMDRRSARKNSIADRCQAVKDIIGDSQDQWLIWCDLNDESATLKKMITNSVEVKGSDSNEHKENSVLGFASGDIQFLITKPSICGFGVNWQSCHNMVFCGISDSFEMYYQAVRRCWRFGQSNTVNVYVVITDPEVNVLQNLNRKEVDMYDMIDNMVKITKGVVIADLTQTQNITETYTANKQINIPNWIQED